MSDSVLNVSISPLPTSISEEGLRKVFHVGDTVRRRGSETVTGQVFEIGRLTGGLGIAVSIPDPAAPPNFQKWAIEASRALMYWEVVQCVNE